MPSRSRLGATRARAPLAVIAAGALMAAGTVTPALAADTTKPLPPDYADLPRTVLEEVGATVTWESGGANGVATLATGPSGDSQAAVYLELLPSVPPVAFGELNQADYVLAGGTKGSATLSFELIVPVDDPDDPLNLFDYPAAQFIPPNGASGPIDAFGEDPTTTADGYWRFDGGAAVPFDELQGANSDYPINKIYLSLGSQVSNSSSSVDSVTVGTAAGDTTTYDFQVPPPAAATPTEVYPGALGEGQIYGWDLVASVGGGELEVDNDSGWSMDLDGTRYAVLDPTAFLDDLGTVSLDTGNYNDIGLQLGEIDALAVSARTDGDGAGPRIMLRLTGGNIAGTCRIVAQMPPTSVMTDFNSLAADWAESEPGSCAELGAPTGWGGVIAALGSTATVSGEPGVPGVSITTGSTQGPGWAPAHIESFTLASAAQGLNDTYAFGPPVLTLSGPEVEVQAGEDVDVLVSGTLSGPNQPTIENVANFLTGPGGLNSGGTFGQTDGTEDLCTVELAEPVTMFAPARVLPTRPLDAVGDWSEVERVTEQPVTVRVTASAETPGGVGVAQGGTCVIGIVDPLNAEPIGGVTVRVAPADDLREALPLPPEEVPADAGALTVEPECVVEGDPMTVTAPAGSFSPDSLVSVGLYDSGVDLGEFDAEADGSLSIEGPLPNGVPDGPQEVLAVGYASVDNNDPTSLSAEFEVGCAGGSGGIPSGIPAGDGGTDGGNGLLGTGLAMLLVVGGYLGLRMRRILSA